MFVTLTETDGWEDNQWIALVSFGAAILCFVVAAASKRSLRVINRANAIRWS